MGKWDKYKKNKPEKNDLNSLNNGMGKTVINWYPGHMAKTKRLISEKINQIDIVYELIDSRIPYSSKIIDIDNYIGSKPRILIMSKYDLCDKKETDKWIKYYESKGYIVLPITLETKKETIIDITRKIMKEKNKIRISKGMNARKTRVLIVGIPNAGKSTLINKLVGKKAVNVGNKPGVTKSLDWIRINDELELLDTPGILWPKFENQTIALNLASLTAIKEEILPIEQVVCYIIDTLYKYYPNILLERYNIKQVDEDYIDVFNTIGKRRGCLVKGGEIDYDKVCNAVMNDIKDGFIKNITFDRYDELKDELK